MTTLKLELTIQEIDMAFVLFQAARQPQYTYEEINTLMRKIQDQGKPQLEALAIKQEAPPPAPKVRKPKATKATELAAAVKIPQSADMDLPDLNDLKLD
jgi:hypothetical protein